MNERFQAGGHEFQLNKIDPFKQFHVVRKLAPVMGTLLPLMGEFASMSEDQLKSDQLDKLQPALEAFSKLSDADAEYILLNLLSAVALKQEPMGNYSQLVVNGTRMFKDVLDMPTMLNCAGRAFMFNLSGFISAAPQPLKSVSQKQNGA